MKHLLIIISLFCLPVISKGQANYSHSDSTSFLNNSVIYIIDGKPVSKIMLKARDIFSKDVLTGKQLEGIYGNKKLDTVTLIITKKTVVRNYQDKLSVFSREYQEYLKMHGYNDDNILYIAHNDPLEKQETLNFLNELLPEKIISVTFANDQPGDSSSRKKVIIDLKVGE